MRWNRFLAPVLGAGLLGVGIWLLRPSGQPAARKAVPVAASVDPFREVTREAGIDYRLVPAKRPMRILESFGSGCGFLDYDGDGWQDILLVGTPRCALYRNRQDGTFLDVTDAAGLGEAGVWVGCATGDYDNDGDTDLFLTGYRRCALLENGGKGRFRDVSRTAGIRMTPWSTAAAFADFDRDGHLDLYVAAYADFGPHTKQYCDPHNLGVLTSCRPFDYDPIAGQCYRNRGNGTFEDVTQAWGLSRTHGRTLGAVVADYDRDGWPDLYLANDEIEADLFQNQKGRGFKEVGVVTGTAYDPDGDVMGGMGVDWGDFDRDGWQDLFVATFEFQPKPLFLNLEGRSFRASEATRSIRSQIHPWVGWGALLFDHDNDGWLDLAFVNSHVFDNVKEVAPSSEYRQPGGLFRNGNGTALTPVHSPTLARPGASRGMACADYDNDGDQDLLILDIDGPSRLLRNELPPDRHWLQVALQGTRGNRDGYGAVVRVTTGGVTQTVEARTSRSYQSACDPRLTFGLGAAAKVERVEVRWPGGAVTQLVDVSSNQRLLVKEPGEE